MRDEMIRNAVGALMLSVGGLTALTASYLTFDSLERTGTTSILLPALGFLAISLGGVGYLRVRIPPKSKRVTLGG